MGSSINTNIAAMTALQSLNSTNKGLLTTQNRVSTGLRVGDASDNAAYWSIATTMRGDRSSISTVTDALGLGSATAEIAAKGIESAIEIAGKIKDKLVAARTPGVDRTKIQSEIKELQESLKAVVDSATFNGQNWLKSDSGEAADANRTIVSSFSRAADGTISIGTITVDLEATRLVDTSTSTGGSAGGILDSEIALASGSDTVTVLDLDIGSLEDNEEDLADLEAMLGGVDAAIEKMTDAASSLGAVKTRIDIQKDFAQSLMDAIDTGVGQLVDADMNAESTKLQALQVRQQLGIQALGIANQNAQMILRLFQ